MNRLISKIICKMKGHRMFFHFDGFQYTAYCHRCGKACTDWYDADKRTRQNIASLGFEIDHNGDVRAVH